MRFAAKRSKSGWTVRSSVATIDQLGFDRQATPSSFWVNRSRLARSGSHRRRPALRETDRRRSMGRHPLHPDAAVGDFNLAEDVRLGELVLLALRRFHLIRT